MNCEPSPLQLVLQDLPERVEEAHEEGQPEGVIFDEVEPVEVWRWHLRLSTTIIAYAL